MRHFLLITLTVLTVSTAFVGVLGIGAAQETTDLDRDLDDLLESDQCEAPQAIDEDTAICDTDLEGDVAVIEFVSEENQRIELTDGAALFAGGEMNQQRFTLREDTRTTVRFRVTTYRGQAGVSVGTTDRLVGVPIKESSALIGEPWSASDVQLATAATALGVIVAAALVVLRALLGRGEQPERVA